MFFSSFKSKKAEKKKRLHYIQHVEFEALGMIEQWAIDRDIEITCTRMYLGEELPDRQEMREIDLLLVMGGPMGICDYEEYPWLKEEKLFLKKAIREATTFKRVGIIGFCLGAQLISDALGGTVTENQYKEIGWFPIRSIDPMLPDAMNVFHWHSDTFSIPRGAKCIAYSQGCANQAFIYKQQVIGLQFHLEMQAEDIEAIYANCADELMSGPYVQLQNISDSSRLSDANSAMVSILERFIQ